LIYFERYLGSFLIDYAAVILGDEKIEMFECIKMILAKKKRFMTLTLLSVEISMKNSFQGGRAKILIHKE